MLASLLVSVTMPRIQVEGNEVLPDDVYRTVLTLTAATSSTSSVADDDRPDWMALADRDPKAAASEVQSRVLDFLLASGYELARVEVEITPDGVKLDVDEGKLDKIIFLREGTLSNIELRFALHLPSEVFNRPLLERKLAALVEDSDITAAHWELVPTESVEHAGIQVEDPQILRGLRLLNPGSTYALHIRLERKTSKEGVSLGLGFNGQDGLFGKASYRLGQLFFDNDRFETETRVGFYLGNGPESSNNPLGISRVQGKVRWSPVPLGFEDVRTFVQLDANLFGRLRDDLEIAAYYFLPIAASLSFDAEIMDAVRVTLGGGAEQRLLFGLDTGDMDLPLIERTPGDELRFFIEMSAEWLINPSELRADRPHRLSLRGRYLAHGRSDRAGSITKAFLEYVNTVELGWDELRYGFHGAHQFGEVPFFDELSIGDGFLRTGFGTQIYTNRAAAIELEYRLSLSRDTLKLSVYNDAAVYYRLDDLREPLGYAFVDSAGVGLHVLLFDAFQLNTYVGVAVDQHLGLDLGLKAEVTKAF